MRTNGRAPTRGASSKSTSVKDRLRRAQLPQRQVPVCLRGDLYVQIQELDAQLRAIERDADDDARFAGDPQARRLSAELERLRQQMVDETIQFTIRALPKDQWTKLEAEHEPRKNDKGDEFVGFDRDTVTNIALRRGLVDPILDDEDWTLLVATITDGQWDALTAAVWALNKGAVDVPFSPAASKVRNFESGSKRPNDSASASDDSTAG